MKKEVLIVRSLVPGESFTYSKGLIYIAVNKRDCFHYLYYSRDRHNYYIIEYFIPELLKKY